jgi:hypothetical protein
MVVMYGEAFGWFDDLLWADRHSWGFLGALQNRDPEISKLILTAGYVSGAENGRGALALS